MSAQIFDLNIFVSDYWEGVSSLSKFLENSNQGCLLHLSKGISLIDSLPHTEFLSTLSEGIITGRSESIFHLFELIEHFAFPIIFYSEVPLLGMMAEMALQCDSFFFSESFLSLQFTRFKGLAPCSSLPLKLASRFGPQALNWYLQEIFFDFGQLYQLGLCHGLSTLSSLITYLNEKKSVRKTLSMDSSFRRALAEKRDQSLQGNEIDPLLQLSFIDLLEKMGFSNKSSSELLQNYFYECALTDEYRSGGTLATHFPKGILHSINLNSESFYPWTANFVLKLLYARRPFTISSQKLNNVLPQIRDQINQLDLSFAIVSSVCDGVVVDENNYLGINFLLGETEYSR